ncbi:MAG: hypothetical protein Unbinned1322contig1000_15 [Prokaryotic dsDNA virus sp.]|nr:hypothetical protein [Aequorivita sp.]QDP57271.1 MAG: hypothetical protein Unbinned1322contig1000_15 [Prokaryotic dsDNA virus sp.]|tara:strand:+ start:4888 stop:5223 length:336 start_codon:yes stop_codon:yes gene_type:complete
MVKLYEGKKSRIRRKPSSSTITPDKRIRTDTLKQIQKDNYISLAGVEYDKAEVDNLLNIRHERAARKKLAKEMREFDELEKLKQEGKIVDESIESTLTDRQIEEDFDDCLF